MIVSMCCPRRRLARAARPLVVAVAALATAATIGVTDAPAASAAEPPPPGAPANPTAPRSTQGGADLASTGVVVHTAPGVPALPASSFSSFVVVDADTGDVLAAKDAHGRYLPASTIKVLAALVLIPRLDTATELMASPDVPSVDGTKVGIESGSWYKVKDLFHAMLMSSANDATLLLAESNAGGVAKTVSQMNAEARSLGARDTLARNPHGLDAADQLTSSYDLAVIFRAAMKLTDFREYMALERTQFPAPNGTTYEIQSHNRLLGHYPGMLGGKDGGTTEAGNTYVAEASRGGHNVIVALMHGSGAYRTQVESLFDWGFAARGKVEPVGSLAAGTTAVSDTNGAGGPDTALSDDASAGAQGAGAASAASAQAARSGGISAWEILGAVLGGLAAAVVALRFRAVRRMRRRRRQRYLDSVARVGRA